MYRLDGILVKRAPSDVMKPSWVHTSRRQYGIPNIPPPPSVLLSVQRLAHDASSGGLLS